MFKVKKTRSAGTPCGCLGGYYFFSVKGKVLRRLCGLIARLATGVPEVYDVDDVTINAVDHLVQTVYDDAAVGTRTVSVEWVDGADVGLAHYHLFCILDPLHELLPGFAAKLPVHITCHLTHVAFR